MTDILVIAEYIRSMPWSNSIWAARLARQLAEQGHRVLVACDGIEDAAVLRAAHPRLTLEIRRPLRKLRASDPLGFARWAQQLRAAHPSARSVSFTRYAAADAWIPLGHAIVTTLTRAVRAHRPATAAMELLHRPWAIQAFVAERRVLREGRSIRGARATLGREGVSSDTGEWREVPLGFASALVPPPAEARAALRERTRALLGIPPHALLLAASGVHTDRPGLPQMLAGLSLEHARAADAPHMLLVGRKTHTLARMCERAGVRHVVHLLGGTDRMDAVLAAADLAVATSRVHDPAATGRFIADALRMGVPVLAAAPAAGACLLRSSSASETSAGLVIDPADPGHWREGLHIAASPAWRVIAGAKAAAIGHSLTLEAMAQRLSGVLDPSPSAHGPSRP